MKLKSLPHILLVALFIGCSAPEPADDSESGLDFASLATAFRSAPPLESFTARDGTELPLRYYERSYERSYDGNAEVALILLHGSGAHGLYLSGLAATIAQTGLADVYTPDLRGHGENPERRGDIDYIDQLGDDVADLIAFIRQRDPKSTVILGGHSSGGGLAIRAAGDDGAHRPDAYLLLAPFLQHDAPTVRPQSGGWAYPKIPKIILLTLLNQLGIEAFNSATVLEFNLPPSRRSGIETLAYSYRLMVGFAPREYRSDIGSICEPALVLVGTDDEAFYADEFTPVFAELAPQARVQLVPGAGHLGLVVEAGAQEAIIAWLRALSAGTLASRCG